MKKRACFFITLPLFALLSAAVLFLLLPQLCDTFLLPRLLANLPFTEKELSLSRLSPWKIRGSLTLAGAEHPPLSIPRFELYSSPTALMRGEISRLLLDSASVTIDLSGGSPVIHGLTPAPATSGRQNKTPALLLPVGIDTILVKNLTLTVKTSKKRSVRLTIDGRAVLEYSEFADGKKRPISLRGLIETAGSVALKVSFEATTGEDGYRFALQADAGDIGEFAAFFPDLSPLQAKGALSFSAKGTLDRQGELTNYQATTKLSSLKVTYNSLVLESGSTGKPATLQLSGGATKSRYALSNLRISEPEEIYLDSEGEIDIPEGGFSGRANLHVERTQTPVAINVRGTRDSKNTRLDYTMVSAPIHITEVPVELSGITAEGTVTVSEATVSTTVNAKLARITKPDSGVTFAEVSLQLPLTFPLSETAGDTQKGRFSIAEIQYRDIASGSFQATLSPTPESIGFTSLFTSPFIPELRLTCTGTATFAEEIGVDCFLPRTYFDESSLPPYVDLDENLAFNARIGGDLHFTMENQTQTGRLFIKLSDGAVSHGTNVVSDINLDLVFPRLPLLHSEPAQLCTIGSMDFGSVRLTDGRVRFRIEDNTSIFFEKSRFNWCGGRVETTSFTVSPELKKLETTLYCDRLIFTELLSQFGIDDAEGEGSLNGRLPLFISSEGLTFDDGFLFSTPGNSGIVRFNDTAKLRQGIPDISQSSYLEYSMRALENFSYNWTKMSFTSEQDDLLITMQLDGKPAEPLPFGYKNGTIVPTDKGPGLDHPIRLDVNFRLPLQEMFQYGKDIQSIMENM